MASGADRRVLTDDGFVEFDPTYSPNGQRIAFGRADAETGRGLGLWERTVDGGDVARIELDGEVPATPGASGTGDDGELAEWLRAPRYAPDGETLAYVDLTGSVGIVDLATDEVVRVAYAAHAPPAWLPDGSAVLLTGRRLDRPLTDPAFDDRRGAARPVGRFRGGRPRPDRRAPSRRAASAREHAWPRSRRTAASRTCAATDRSASPMGPPTPAIRSRASATSASAAVTFAPGEEAIAVVILDPGDDDTARGRIERIELDDGARDILTNEGWRPRWLP